MRQNCAKLSVKDQLPLPANTTTSPQTPRLKGAFFWDYSVDSYSGIRITEHTEYQFPKEQTLWYSENKIADVTKIKAMRPRKTGYAIFPPKDERKLPKDHNYRLFCLFRTNSYSVEIARGPNERKTVIAGYEWSRVSNEFRHKVYKRPPIRWRQKTDV